MVCASVRASRPVLARSSLRSAAASVRSLAQTIAMGTAAFGVRDWSGRCETDANQCPNGTGSEGEQAKSPGVLKRPMHAALRQRKEPR